MRKSKICEYNQLQSTVRKGTAGCLLSKDFPPPFYFLIRLPILEIY